MASDDHLPPEEDRISLREAAQLFDPPTSKKALESLMQRGRLRVWREPPSPERPDRSSRVVTTRAALEEYARSPSARRRLRAEGEAAAPATGHWGRPTIDPMGMVGRDVYELRAQLHELRARVEALEAKAGD